MGTFSTKLVALAVLLSPLAVQAAKPGPTVAAAWPGTATLTVSDSHELVWPPYPEFEPQGYDVYYDVSSQVPGYNPTRIDTGARSPWTDVLPGVEARCVADNYWIRAYDKGRKNYSPELRAAPGALCGPVEPVAPIANAGPDQIVVIGDTGMVVVALNGSGSSTNEPDVNIQSYDWNVTDGPSTPSIASGETTSVTLDAVGEYTITLMVTDNNGMTDVDILVITVSDTQPPPPETLFSDAQGDIPDCSVQTKLMRDVNTGKPVDYPTLKFSDEFNGSSLDPTVWNSRYEWNTIINSEAQYYVDALGGDAGGGNWSPFSISGGKLTITARKTVDAGLNWLTNQPYVSGVLNTQHKKSFNGAVNGGLLFEAYARPARGNGMWSAFWLYHRTYKNPDPEIDIFEYLGQSKDTAGNWLKASNKDGVPEVYDYNTWDTQYHTYYPGSGGPKGKKVSNYTNQKPWDAPAWCGEGVDFSYAFHKYSVEWTSAHIKWYIDDILLHTVTSAERNIANEEMYIILNLAIGSNAEHDVSWPGAPDTYTTDLMSDGNTKMVVDYVRVYGK